MLGRGIAGVEAKLQALETSGLKGGKWLIYSATALLPWKEATILTGEMRPAADLKMVVNDRTSSTPAKNRNAIFKPVVSHCSNWGISVQITKSYSPEFGY
jgi:hypothetical protein